MERSGYAARARLLCLGALLIAALLPASAQAAFPGTNGEIRISVRDDSSFDSTYTAIDPASGDVSLVPGVPAGLYAQARSSADGRTIAFNDETLGKMQVIRDGTSIGTRASCGPILAEESQVLHTRRVDPDAGDGCSGASASFGASTTEVPFGDQTVDARADGRPLVAADPDGDAFYFTADLDSVMRVGPTGAATQLVPTGNVGESDPGNDCDCYILFRRVDTRVVDVSPDGESLLITREVREHESCFGDDSSGGFCDVNPSTRNRRSRFVVAEADTGTGQLTELSAFSTPFVAGSDPQPPERVPLGYSPDGEELLLEGNTSRLGNPAQGEDPNTWLFTSKALLRADLGTGLEQEIRVLDDPAGDAPTSVTLLDAQWLPGECPAPAAARRTKSAGLSSSGSVPGSEAAGGGSPGVPRAIAARGSGGLKLRAIEPGEAVVGAGVTLLGRGLSGKSLRAKVGSKKARVSSSRKGGTVLVVPKLRPGKYRVVVRRGRKRSSSSLRVVKPFDGSPGFTLDAGAKRTATIGPAGGTLSARGSNGVEFELSIPAGALTAPQAIALTPVKHFAGLPFSGEDVAGAALEPDGLQLARPGTLTISGAGKFSSDSVAFAFGDASGFEVAAPAAAGRTIVIPVSHFSQHGAAEAAEADIASALQPILDAPRALSRSQIRYLLGLLALFDERFSAISDQSPPGFCTRQPVCRQAVTKGISSIETEIANTCTRGKARPTLFALRELSDLRSDLELLTSSSSSAADCLVEIANLVVEKVTAALKADPLARFRLFELPSGASGDIDGDGDVSAFEMARALVGEFDLLALGDQALTLDEASSASLLKLLQRNRALCETDARDTAAVALRRGFAYARAIGSLQTDFLEALRACGVGLVISPANVVMGTNDQQLFEAILTNTESGDPGSVTWSASGGEIRSDGLFANYTAPDTEGQFTVTARSTANPARTAEARVTVDDELCGAP